MKDLLILAGGRALQLAGAYLTIKISTTLLSPAQVGSVNQLSSLASLFAAGLLMPVVVYFARALLGWRAAGMHGVRLRAVLSFLPAAAGVFALAAWGVQQVSGVVGDMSPGWVAGLILVYTTFFPVHMLAINCTSVLGFRGWTALLANAAIWTGLGLAALLFLASGRAQDWALGLFLGYGLSAAGLAMVPALARRARPADPGEPMPFGVRPVFEFAWPQVLFYGLWWVQSQSYRFQLDAMHSLAAVGLFFAAYALCSVPMQAFEAAVQEYHAPTLYRRLAAGGAEATTRAWNAFARVYAPAIVLFGCLLAAAAPHVAVLALGPAFQGMSTVLLLPAAAEVARALGSASHTLGVAKLDMRHTLPPAAAGAIGAPVLVGMLAPADALYGTGAALLAANALAFVLTCVLTRARFSVRWPWGRMALALGAGLPMVVTGQYLFRSYPASWAAALVVCAGLGAYASVVLLVIGRDWWREGRGAAVSAG